MVVPFGWQPSPRNNKIQLSVSAMDGTTMANAFLSMTKAKHGRAVWRAVLRVVGDKQRKFGTHSEDPVVTAKNLLESMGFLVANDEQDRVVKIVKDLCGTTSHGSQPSNSPCVAIIHQIYGLFRDGKGMPKLFETSQMRWRQVAKQMGATYHLWSADEVDALMKKRFAFLCEYFNFVVLGLIV
jgi:hypothetical protein